MWVGGRVAHLVRGSAARDWQRRNQLRVHGVRARHRSAQTGVNVEGLRQDIEQRVKAEAKAEEEEERIDALIGTAAAAPLSSSSDSRGGGGGGSIVDRRNQGDGDCGKLKGGESQRCDDGVSLLGTRNLKRHRSESAFGEAYRDGGLMHLSTHDQAESRRSELYEKQEVEEEGEEDIKQELHRQMQRKIQRKLRRRQQLQQQKQHNASEQGGSEYKRNLPATGTLLMGVSSAQPLRLLEYNDPRSVRELPVTFPHMGDNLPSTHVRTAGLFGAHPRPAPVWLRYCTGRDAQERDLSRVACPDGIATLQQASNTSRSSTDGRSFAGSSTSTGVRANAGSNTRTSVTDPVREGRGAADGVKKLLYFSRPDDEDCLMAANEPELPPSALLLHLKRLAAAKLEMAELRNNSSKQSSSFSGNLAGCCGSSGTGSSNRGGTGSGSGCNGTGSSGGGVNRHVESGGAPTSARQLLAGRLDSSALVAVAVLVEELVRDMVLNWSRTGAPLCYTDRSLRVATFAQINSAPDLEKLDISEVQSRLEVSRENKIDYHTSHSGI